MAGKRITAEIRVALLWQAADAISNLAPEVFDHRPQEECALDL
jgi:hypothetical protein